MINNDIKNQLNRYFNRGANGEGDSVQDILKRLKSKHDAIRGRNDSEEGAEADAGEKTAAKASDTATTGLGGMNNLFKSTYGPRLRDKNVEKAAEEEAKRNSARKTDKKETNDKNAAQTEEDLSPAEKRRKELQAILDKINAEEAYRYPNRVNNEKDKIASTETTEAGAGVTTNLLEDDSGGFPGFLNDMPLFNEFKTGLMDAFSRLDSASAGSLSAQYELNYTSMKYIANAAGGYDYEETNFNFKLDLNYIKAASGGNATGKELADAIGSAKDMGELVENLKNAGQGQQAAEAAKGFDPDSMMTNLKDYFSPENTAGRIVDFASAFFPLSEQYKKLGDTEEARKQFAETMKDAIDKGFDQAKGILGAVPKDTADGIDKTYDLVQDGLADFIKNGLNKNKQDNGAYSALEQFSLNAQVSYSRKTVMVRANPYQGIGQQNEAATARPDEQSKVDGVLDAQA